MSSEMLLNSIISKHGIAGAPLLNENWSVVGLYNGLWDRQMNLQRKTYKATNIQSVLNAFKTYVVEQLGGKTENELWLERITQMQE